MRANPATSRTPAVLLSITHALMTPFGRFLLVLAVLVLVALGFGGGPFAGLSILGTACGLVISAVATVFAALFSVVFGAVGVVIGLVAMVPLLIPVLLLASPVILLVAFVLLLARAAA